MYRRGTKGWAKHFDFIFLDYVCLEISLLIAYMVRHGGHNPFLSDIYRDLFLVLFFIDFAVILFLDTMKNVLKRGYYREFVSSVWQAVGVLLCVTAYMFFSQEGGDYSRMTILMMICFYLISSYIVRIAWKKILSKIIKSGNKNSLLLIVDEDNIMPMIQKIVLNNYGMHQITGAVVKDVSKVGSVIEGIQIVADYDSVIEYVTNHWVDEIFISINIKNQIAEDMIDNLIAMGVTVHLGFEATDLDQVGVKQIVGNIGGVPVLTSSMNYMSPRQYFLKRCMDIAGGLVGCVITGFLCIFLVPAIKKESPGPVFFTQMRIGKNGKPFKMYKFRSMYLDAEERKQELMAQNRLNNNLMFKMDFDPRVIGNRIDEDGNRKTGIGEFIRSYSLDEFPQFFNVLKGDMSLIGTRPPLVSEYEAYSSHHKARLAVIPGITGLWQVSGRSNVLDFEEVVKLDTQYINNWSVGLDLKILFKTITVVLKKEGSM